MKTHIGSRMETNVQNNIYIHIQNHIEILSNLTCMTSLKADKECTGVAEERLFQCIYHYDDHNHNYDHDQSLI